MLGNQSVTNEKPRDLAVPPVSWGNIERECHSNFTPMLNDSKSRYEKGMRLYEEGKVKIRSNGLFKVSGYYDTDPENMTCGCPDYKKRKEACKHLFAAMLFVKNRGRVTIENLEGFNGNGNGSTHKAVESAKDAPKHLDRQSTITRLAVLNTATEILKTHRKAIDTAEVISFASQLERWALGGNING
jgi:SWIM zinc finger